MSKKVRKLDAICAKLQLAGENTVQKSAIETVTKLLSPTKAPEKDANTVLQAHSTEMAQGNETKDRSSPENGVESENIAPSPDKNGNTKVENGLSHEGPKVSPPLPNCQNTSAANIQSASGSSRRKRKNFQPRNIKTFDMGADSSDETKPDELQELAINNQGVDFQVITNSPESYEKAPTSPSLNHSVFPEASVSGDNHYNTAAALDFSTRPREEPMDFSKSANASYEPRVDSSGALDLSDSKPTPKGNDSSSPWNKGTGVDQNTQGLINDLLGRYGWIEGSGQPEAKKRRVTPAAFPAGFTSGGDVVSQQPGIVSGIPHTSYRPLARRPDAYPTSHSRTPPPAYHATMGEPEMGTPLGNPPSMVNSFGSPDLEQPLGEVIKRFDTSLDCGSDSCRKFALKEHCHCASKKYGCDFKLLMKKDEISRHEKWHRKRDDARAYNFDRHGTDDNCTNDIHAECFYNGKQTHYHCLIPGCSTVYISTSDVQMHFNYHRKTSAIINAGFRRFKASEDCGINGCSFRTQRTTHFHCIRANCSFTFKHKADMDKHKTYHDKDEMLARDGFKKFMKYEHCPYQTCRYSKVSNHIHCMRSGCGYVLQSTSQLYSHKRKHERKGEMTHFARSSGDSDSFKTDFSPSKTEGGVSGHGSVISPALARLKAELAGQESFDSSGGNSPLSSVAGGELGEFAMGEDDDDDMVPLHDDDDDSSQGNLMIDEKKRGSDDNTQAEVPKPRGLMARAGNDVSLSSSLNLLTDDTPEATASGNSSHLNQSSGSTISAADESRNVLEMSGASSSMMENSSGSLMRSGGKLRDNSWKDYLTRYTANDHCMSRCDYLYKDHYHCNVTGCEKIFKGKEGVRDHALNHRQQDEVTTTRFIATQKGDKCQVPDCQHSERETHYHCNWMGCREVILSSEDFFNRLQHQKIHDASTRIGRPTPPKKSEATEVAVATPEEVKRKRGRPSRAEQKPILSVPRVVLTSDGVKQFDESGQFEACEKTVGKDNFANYTLDEACPDAICAFKGKAHSHCALPRCHFATERGDFKRVHTTEFHKNITILDDYEFYDCSVPCRRPYCDYNKTKPRHFHCTRPRCSYTFVRASTMQQHTTKHDQDIPSGDSPATQIPSNPFMTSAMNLGQQVMAPAFMMGPGGIPMIMPQPLMLQGAGGVPLFGTFPMAPVMVSGASPFLHATAAAAAMSGAQAVTKTVMSYDVKPSVVSPPPAASASGDSNEAPASSLPLSELVKQELRRDVKPTVEQLVEQGHHSANGNCGRPFCKLKKKDHYHCQMCKFAASEKIRIKYHMSTHGHGVRNQKRLEAAANLPETTHNYSDDDTVSPMMPPAVPLDNPLDDDNSSLDLSVASGSSPRLNTKLLKDSATVPDGFSFFKSTDDCEFDKCAHKLSLNHFHCLKPLCKASFNDKNRMVQHNLRHERTEKLMGGEFRQYKQYISCGMGFCDFSEKSTHYHCTQCDYSCIDTAKVTAHRKGHQKRAFIDANGFEKTAAGHSCSHKDCAYSGKQTHYHCTAEDCGSSVLTPGNMPGHRAKHINEKLVIPGDNDSASSSSKSEGN